MVRAGLILGLVVLVGACSPTVVYVYPDAPVTPAEDAGVQGAADAPAAGEDAAWAEGACLPERTAGAVSSADCHRYPDRPVCDGWTDTCVPPPSTYCGACETDEQCQLGVDVRTDCVFLPYAPRELRYNDQACLARCEVDTDCDFLPRPEWWGVRCMQLARGGYCVVPFAPSDTTPGPATCSDFMGGRRGSP